VYMGDLHGNMWKLDFDLASFTKLLKDVTFSDLVTGTSAGAVDSPLFVAKDALGNVQPITMTPKLVYGPNKGTIVMFGTGKYLETSDTIVASAKQQSVYAINDIKPGTRPKNVAGRGFLEKGVVGSGTITVASFIWGRASTVTDTTQRSGWFFDYAATGERQLGDFTTDGTMLYFGSLIPPQSLTATCDSGTGNIYAINFATGNGSSTPSTVGIVGQIFIQETIDADISNSDSTGRRTSSSTKRMLIKGADGYSAPAVDIKTVSTLGRLSWRQINNYYELKNK
jgi:type IV pilus assembly protein PilY1